MFNKCFIKKDNITQMIIFLNSNSEKYIEIKN